MGDPGYLTVSSSLGLQYGVVHGDINSSSGANNITMTLGEGSNTGTIFMIPMDNGSDYNNSGNMTFSEPFTTPLYTLVWVTICNILVFVAGVLGNLLVIIVVLCVREMKTATNLCLMNLSVADLLVLLICQPSALLEFFCQEKWLIGEVMCKLTVFLENLVTLASILIILTVSLERFWAVYYPLKTYSQGSKKKAMISMVVVWIISAVISSPFLFLAFTVKIPHNIDKETVDVCLAPIHLTWHKAYIVGRFVLVFVIPLICLFLAYTLIIIKVVTQTMECKQMTESAKSHSQQNRKQLVIMLVAIIILFFICLLPFRIIALYTIFTPPHWIMYKLGPESYLNLLCFCRLLIYVNSAGNPIIYNIVSTKFRRGCQKVLRTYCCRYKRWLNPGRGTMNGTYSPNTRMTTMSHYSVVKTDLHDMSDTGDAV